LRLNGHIPDEHNLKTLQRKIGQDRVEVFSKVHHVLMLPTNGMDYLRAAIAGIEFSDSESEIDISTRLIAAVSVAAASWHRRKMGRAPLAPDASLTHAEDFLRMSLDREPDARFSAALNSYLVTVSDHGMNASTLAARVVASTGSDLTSSIVAGIGALKGPLHGGAPGPVLDMLESIGKPENAKPWLETELSAGRRIMGMGHRIYRVRDPRAAVLEQATLKLENSGIKSRRLSLARAVESAAAKLLAERYPDRPLKANVEFFTAVLLDAIGLPRELFSPTFALGRVVGWCAHVAEQRKFGRLVRPKSEYVGPFPTQ
jgi:citrate synthase